MNVIGTAIIGGGCFWCVEGVFRQFEGIVDVVPGYSGGDTENPTYEDVCKGDTNHAEVVKVIYKTSNFSYKEILEIFFSSHDPTTLNRQGNDIGTQYRSVIYIENQEEEKVAKEVIDEMTQNEVFESPIVTEVAPLDVFYPAEKYHHDYYADNSDQPYCQIVIAPKINNIRLKYMDKLK